MKTCWDPVSLSPAKEADLGEALTVKFIDTTPVLLASAPISSRSPLRTLSGR